MNSLILALFLYNATSIFKKISLSAMIILIYLSFLVNVISSENDVFKNYFLYFTENSYELIYRAYIVVILAVIAFAVVLVFFNYSSPLKHAETKEIENIINEIRGQLSIGNWITIKLHREPRTFLNRLYVPLNMLNSIRDINARFVLLHEKAHIVSYDSFCGLFEKASSILLAIILSWCLMAELPDNISESYYLYDSFYVVITVFLFIIIFYIIVYFEFTTTRFKEHLCDMYAKEKLSDLRYDFDLANSKSTISHPSSLSRERFLNHEKIYLLFKVVLYESLHLVIFYYLMNFGLYSPYKAMMMFVILVHVIFFCWIMRCCVI